MDKRYTGHYGFDPLGNFLVAEQSVAVCSDSNVGPLDLPKAQSRSINEFIVEIFNTNGTSVGHSMRILESTIYMSRMLSLRVTLTIMLLATCGLAQAQTSAG